MIYIAPITINCSLAVIFAQSLLLWLQELWSPANESNQKIYDNNSHYKWVAKKIYKHYWGTFAISWKNFWLRRLLFLHIYHQNAHLEAKKDSLFFEGISYEIFKQFLCLHPLNYRQLHKSHLFSSSVRVFMERTVWSKTLWNLFRWPALGFGIWNWSQFLRVR